MDMRIQRSDRITWLTSYQRLLEQTGIKIRGIRRNFQGLKIGDPGVGTYYNGVYSPDFGITAATEGGLYDIQQVEVLRGP